MQRERAKVLNDGMEYLAQLIRHQNPELDCPTAYEALQFMKHAGFGDALKDNNRNIPSLVNALALEGFADETSEAPRVSADSSMAQIIAAEMEKRSAKTMDDVVAKSEDYMEGMKRALGVVPTEVHRVQPEAKESDNEKYEPQSNPQECGVGVLEWE